MFLQSKSTEIHLFKKSGRKGFLKTALPVIASFMLMLLLILFVQMYPQNGNKKNSSVSPVAKSSCSGKECSEKGGGSDDMHSYQSVPARLLQFIQ